MRKCSWSVVKAKMKADLKTTKTQFCSNNTYREKE
jgi:hypothetical protein